MMKIFVDSIGCRLNQSEIEKIAAHFSAEGHSLVDKPADADVVVINTCAVTGKAVSDSRRAVRQAALKQGVRVITTGCWASLEPENILRMAENIEVVGNPEKESIPAQIMRGDEAGHALSARVPLPGARFRTRAFIKVQDGCDQHCTFCVTRIARGKARSVPAADVLADIHWARSGGAQEVVLTGVNLGAWGKDLTSGLRLKQLIDDILRKTDIPRLRLSSLEPWDLDADLFELWRNERMCRHLHLPLQSGSDTILKKMGRLTSQESFAELVTLARSIVPEMAISTDMIVGFPGETEAQFEESMDFIREINFFAGHVFAYSPRPGTAAAKLPNRVADKEIKRRSRRMRALFDDCRRRYCETFKGKTVDVLWESAIRQENGVWRLKGMSSHSLRVEAQSPVDRWNQIDPVRLAECRQQGIHGEIRQV